MDKSTINRGKQLRFVREYRGYDQKKLCDKIPGLSQSNLSKYEHGLSGMIQDDKVKEVMKFLNWPYEWLNVNHPEPQISGEF